MPEPERRRRRPAISCTLCRKRKLRCNREQPCTNCLRSRSGTCVYTSDAKESSRPSEADLSGRGSASPGNSGSHLSTSTAVTAGRSKSSREPSLHTGSAAVSASSATSPGTHLSSGEIESIRTKIRKLEGQLSQATSEPAQSPGPSLISNIATFNSQVLDTSQVHRDSRVFGLLPQTVSRSVAHKTRLFGQSHWVTGAMLFRDIFDMVDAGQENTPSAAQVKMRRCKELSHLIKKQRAPTWPLPPVPDLPPKDVSDKLVDAYFRTIETVHRILHVPTFRKEYEAIWTKNDESSTPFLIQLKLVLALGAITYDENFTFRASAVQWVYEGQTWVSKPEFKSRLSIQFLQTNLLLLIAREYTNVGGDLVSVSSGSLLRTAIYMGLHRDPAHLPIKTPFVAEMRRRLWNSILEFTLDSCMTSGSPPLISSNDFDTEIPGNFDDAQMESEELVPSPGTVATQTSIAIALRKTMPVRLAVLKHLNDLHAGASYEETLRLDTELRTAYKTLCQTLRALTTGPGNAPSSFALRVVELMLQRTFMALHCPFFGKSLKDKTFAFSRTVIIDSSVKIWCATYSASSIVTGSPGKGELGPNGPELDDLGRLSVCGFGMFRMTALLSSLFGAIELKMQLEGRESLGPIPLRPDLLTILDEAKWLAFHSIRAGETNIKGYVLLCMAQVQIEGLKRGASKEELPKMLINSVEEAENACLEILETMAGQTYNEAALQSIDYTPGMVEDWDFMMPAGFDLGDPGFMPNVFNDVAIHEPIIW